MRLIGLMPVRNEAWILGASLRVALKWCDSVIVLNHASTDRTARILEEEYQNNPVVLTENDGRWSEMEHRQRLLDRARALGATHIALIDADEILTGNLLPTIRQEIEKLQPGQALMTGMFAMWRSLDRYRSDAGAVWSNRYDLTLAFCDSPELCWTATGGYEHHSRAPKGVRYAQRIYGGGVMHLQWASWRRLTAKHAFYKMMERIKYPAKSVHEIDRLYSLALDEKGLTMTGVPLDWWEPYNDLRRYIDLEAEPWQESQCRAWLSEYGPEKFSGLDLFGVIPPDVLAVHQ